MWNRVHVLLKELIDNPFFPLLFWSEFIKIIAVSGKVDVGMLALSVISTILWVWAGDEIYEKADETIDDVEDTVADE